MAENFLSKTKIKLGTRCPKALYLSNNKSKRSIDRATQLRFEEGNLIGSKARDLFPSGELIDTLNPSDALARTSSELKNQRKVLFEAAFAAKGAFVRLDILCRLEDGWELIEVKAAKSLKDEHIEDVAIQAWVARSAGLNLTKVSVMHLNPECRFPETENLFSKQDVSERCLNFLGLDEKVRDLSAVLAHKEVPNVKIGIHCDEPRPCDFRSSCMEGFPEPSVFDLPGIGTKKGWKLVGEGKIAPSDLKGTKQSEKVLLNIKAYELGQPIMKADEFRAVVESWEFPMYFLDFETLAPAIPRYAGCAPMEEIPFQFSLHIQRSLSEEATHTEYLHLETSDPRRPIAELLVQQIGATGSVVAFNASVEKGILSKLANLFPDLAASLHGIIGRIVDPLPVFREHMIHPAFKGDNSIKTIAPVLAGKHLDYSLLAVKDGMEARAVAESLIRNGVKTETDKAERQALYAYCKQDTLAMVELTKWMREPTR